jgi:uncharacterized membrane protein
MTTLSQDTTPAAGQNLNDQAGPDINISQPERLASVLGGSLLTLFGIRRRSTFGAFVAVMGGSLVYRGLTGHCSTYAAMGKNTAEPRES